MSVFTAKLRFLLNSITKSRVRSGSSNPGWNLEVMEVVIVPKRAFYNWVDGMKTLAKLDLSIFMLLNNKALVSLLPTCCMCGKAI